MGRGTCFTTVPLTYMTKSNNTTATALPKFWVRALQALRKLTLNQGSPGQCATQEEAKAMPVFYNPLFEIRNRKHMDSWTELLQLRTIGDTINESDTSGDYSMSNMRDYIEEACKVENGFVISTSGPDIKMETLLKQWASILLDIPAWLRENARFGPTKLHDDRYSIQREISWRRWVGAAEAQSANQEKVSRIPLPRRGSAQGEDWARTANRAARRH